MKAIKKGGSRFCLVIVGCSIALLLAEGLIRLFYPYSRDHVIPGGLFEIDEYLGWKLTASKSSIHHSRYFDVTYHINNLGYRDKLRSLKKHDHTYRILLYGDSQIFGWGISEDQRFSNLLEEQIQDLEIWNLAVPGYGLDQQILSYERDGKNFMGDEVIFFIDNNTLQRTRHDYIYKKYKPKFHVDQNKTLTLALIPEGTHVWTTLLYKILSPLYLPYFFERQFPLLKSTPKKPGIIDGRKTNTVKVSFDDLVKSILDRVKSRAHERNHLMTIMAPSQEIPRNNLYNFCTERGINFLELVLSEENHENRIGKMDRHWSMQAHNLIAKQLLSHIAGRIGQ